MNKTRLQLHEFQRFANPYSYFGRNNYETFMRISTISAVLILLSAHAFSQKIEMPPSASEALINNVTLNSQATQPKKANIDIEDWFAWWADWASFRGGFEAQGRFFVLYPDTFVKSLFEDENTSEETEAWVAWCSVGQGFDPKDQAWSDPNLYKLKDWYSYVLDSALVNYGYFRQNPDTTIVDTLMVQVYRNIGNGGQLLAGGFNNSPAVFAVPSINRKTGLGSNHFELIKIPLTHDLETPIDEDGAFRNRTLRFAINEANNGLRIDPKQVAHVTVTFKPGQEYSMGDTLFMDPDLVTKGAPEPTKKLNRFGVIVSTQTPNIDDVTSYNNGSFVVNWNRYQGPTDLPMALRSTYFPGPFGTDQQQFAYFPQIGFHVSDPVGIDDPTHGFTDLSVFPNPAVSHTMISFSLEKPSSVRVTVKDLTGKVVMTLGENSLSSGQQNISLNTSELDGGLYFCTLATEQGEISTKFTVSH